MDDFHFAMVSEWMTNGNINEFIEADREANRFELVGSPSRHMVFLTLTVPSNSSKMLLTGCCICTVEQ